ncbi:MAG TPA: DUF3575 domain-containing protein [Bacteroidia bacterium]|nr:DUF3575 domain-containing protein [Bacteroidia bacterium]
MLKYYILAVMLLISFPGYSKNRHSSRFRIEGIAVKTDVLSLLNTAINKGSKSYSLSGEIYFNNEYSFTIDLGAETETRPGWKRTGRRYGSQFRWYFKQDDCHCSAFFAAGYFSFVNNRQSVDHNLPHNNANSYNKSSSEAGLSGGFQAILGMHFVIDPAVQIGMEFPRDIHNTESMKYPADDKDNLLLVRISLGIGYRF